MTNNRILALFLALAISTILSGILAIQTTAVFAQGNVTQAGNQTGNKTGTQSSGTNSSTPSASGQQSGSSGY
ncbi:MAG TPA: hypothetical protein VJM74_05485 [Nitrososphaeraceae archaeon]|nr:hypothetical protein [Nitrososphaeraceae archaeon]